MPKPDEMQRQFQRAFELHRAGDLAGAAAGYRAVLARQPRHADALHLLGVASYQQGNLAEAVHLIRSALALNSRSPDYHLNLGEVLRAQGDTLAARAAYEHALRLKPDFALAWNNLGIALGTLRQWSEAEAAYRRAIELRPDSFEAWHNLGALQIETGRSADALPTLENALRLNPRSGEALCSLGNALHRLGRSAEALQAIDRALALEPGLAKAWYNRGNVLQALERDDDALVAYAEAIRRAPGWAEAHNNRANVLRRLNRNDEALVHLEQAIRLNPHLADAWNNLGLALNEKGEVMAAQQALRQAIALQPDDSKAYTNLALVQLKLEQPQEGLATIRRALEIKPDSVEALNNYGLILTELGRPGLALEALNRALALAPGLLAVQANRANALLALDDSDEAFRTYASLVNTGLPNWGWAGTYLFALNTSDRHSPEEIARIHLTVGQTLEHSVTPVAPLPVARPVSDRRIRVGFVSPDFRDHAVACFLEPLWRHYDRGRFEFIAYANVHWPDTKTEQLKMHVERWRSIVGLTDEAACRLIRDDAPDILVDLAGHTRYNRLRLFALRAAAIQASWLGYPNTTGLGAIDYRITDALADPPGMTEDQHREQLLRLRGSGWCYTPPENVPTEPLPMKTESRPFTFGSFNNPYKISRRTVELWSRVLHAVPEARFRLKGKSYLDPEISGRLVARFAEFGISRERLVITGWTPDRPAHFASYAEMDVSLDTFPYHGTTTTCEALWMGVPVVTLAGRTHVSRVGVSLLNHAGLPELVAQDQEEFVAIARRLASDQARLAGWRRALRAQLRASALMDGPRFARDFGEGCEQMVAEALARQRSV